MRLWLSACATPWVRVGARVRVRLRVRVRVRVVSLCRALG